MNQMNMAAHQAGKGIFAFAAQELPEQFGIGPLVHSTVICPRNANGDKVFRRMEPRT
jgi:hypothetical protein